MDPWSVLDVSKGASDEDIKAAYRKLALQYHPDRHAGAGAAHLAAASKRFNEARRFLRYMKNLYFKLYF